MIRIVALITISLYVGSGCAGCGPLGDVDDGTRNEGGGTPNPWDGGADLGGIRGEDTGADGTQDADAASADGPDVASSAPDATGAVDMGHDTSGDGPICGNAVLELGEACDDGLTADCVGTHDGGDGVCVALGTCAAEYVYDGSTCVAAQVTQHVHIYVANDCTMMVDPPSFTAPRGQTVRFEWHNHSVDYPVDVWQSYIGGFTDLAPGMTWREQFEWCFNVNPYTGYSDISSAPGCPEHRFSITCNGR